MKMYTEVTQQNASLRYREALLKTNQSKSFAQIFT